MKKEKRSPLKDRPLRNPGQSLDEEINTIIDEEGSTYVMIPILCIVIAGLEWWKWYDNIQPSPLIWTFFAVCITAYSLYKLFGLRKRVSTLRQGRDGERAVGQYLELLREKGYRIYHDLIDDNFNLDHVIICEHGIFVIETKTYSKPIKGSPKIIYDGQKIIIDGFDTQQKIIIQAKAEANWLRSVISESTGMDLPVRPVIVFPGWYVEATNGKKNTAAPWVLNPKALPKYIENSPKILDKETMMLVSYHISRYIRAGSN